MNSIDLPTLMTTIFVLVDDWYQHKMQPWLRLHPGPRASFSDSEVLTLALLMDYLPFPGETQFLSFITANYREWFPHLLDQSQFNRRLRTLDGVLEQLRRFWVEQLGVGEENSFVLDTKPIPVIGLKRNKRNSDFSGSATPGWCAARQMHYFGYKLVVLATWQGVPVAYDLVPANTDERQAAEGVLQCVRGSDIYADQGFISASWQAAIALNTGNRLWTVKRTNQHQQHSPEINRFISRVRQRIEGVFHEIQNTLSKPRTSPQ